MSKPKESHIACELRVRILPGVRVNFSHLTAVETLEKRVLFSAAPLETLAGAITSTSAATIVGYSYVGGNPNSTNNIEIDISGGPGPQTISANLPSPELNGDITGNHDFSYAVPVLSAGVHTVSIYAINGTKALIGTATITSQNSLFDEHYYLMENPDVAAAATAGTIGSGYDHYIKYGQFESRSPSPYWSEKIYLQTNPDVAAAVKAGTISSGFMHFYLYGQYEGRLGLPYFDSSYYLQNNPDVVVAVASRTIASAFEQFVLYGQYEGRSPTPLFVSTVYDAHNPDIAPFVNGEPLSSDFEQYVMYGQYEGRTAVNLTPTEVKVEQAMLGAANLEGKVNATDFQILATNFNRAVSGWDLGDFHYDGSDFATLAANFNQNS
jgi:hypothetical protein